LPALADFGVWAIALVCLGIAFLAVVLIYAIGTLVIDILNKIPTVNIGTGWLDSLVQSVTHALGVAFHKMDAFMGWQLHNLADLIEWLWKEFRNHAVLIAEIASGVYFIALAYRELKALVHRLTTTHDGTAARVKTLEREYKGIEAQVKQLEREYRGIDETGLRKKLNAIGNEVDTIRTQTIPAIQSEAGAAQGDVISLGGLFGVSFPIPSKTTLATVGAGILTALGLNWLRCNSNPFNGNKNACSLWSDLAKFLPSLAFLAIAFDFHAFVDAAETVAEGIGTAVGDIEGTFALELPPLPPPGT